MQYELARKKRRLSPIEHEVRVAPQVESPSAPGLWNLEQDYEQRPRKQKENLTCLRLPIKTVDGRLEPCPVVVHSISQNVERSGELSDASDDRDEQDHEVDQFTDGTLDSARLSVADHKAQIVEAKEELAKLAALINEDPEAQIGLLRSLAYITSSKIPQITKLGLATQLAVYKDIIPGYRIRPMAEGEVKERLSKDIKKLRNFEQAIVGNYQKYVKELGRIVAIRKSSSSDESAGLASVALSCTCSLLKAVPHFNFRTDLLKILADVLSNNSTKQDFMYTSTAFQTLFENDDDGNASLEAVVVLAKMMKAKAYRVPEQVLNLFLSLRLLTEFSKKGSTTSIDRPEIVSSIDDGKGTKPKKEFRTKKQRKYLKERKGIEDEFKEADAVVSHEQRDQMQAETLKTVFGVYFRVLRARRPNLMAPVLEGLVKYAHLINQNFFGDLLEALKDLIEDARSHLRQDFDELHENKLEESSSLVRDTTRESLLCIITAFALLQGQDAASAASSLSLDLGFFVSHLYRLLYEAALCPSLESHTVTESPNDKPVLTRSVKLAAKVDVQTLVVLLLRSLQAVLLPANSRSVPPVRLGAFAKQILTSALHVPEKSCTALLGLTVQVLKIHRKKISGLWCTEERRGDGVFDPLHTDVEASNPFATTIWEGELLRLHYSSSVREGVRSIEAALVEV